MFDTNMMYKFNGVAHDDKAPWGPNRGARYATDWTVRGGRQYRVSSVKNTHTTETMLFRIEGGEASYFDLWADREFYTNPSQHAKFLGEYLQNLGS